MLEVRKVSASAGAEWLLGGFGLLRKAPLGLGLLGALYGVLALLVSLSMERNMDLFLLLQLGLVLIGPLLLGGFVFAARSVDQGGKAEPGQLLQGPRSGRSARLLATLLPQVIALVVCGLLLLLLVGSGELAQMAQTIERMQGQATPDPALVEFVADRTADAVAAAGVRGRHRRQLLHLRRHSGNHVHRAAARWTR